MENVPEFTGWGPLVAARDKQGRVIKKDGNIAAKGEYVPYNEQALVPDKKRSGKTFKAFVKELQRLGYKCEFNKLTACDFGAPTTRTRLFGIFRSDSKPIVWPEPTHGNPESLAVKNGKRLPWIPASEIIDWNIDCPSIFERKKPLAENTLKRIAKGIQKYIIDNPEPFIVQVNHSGEQFRGQTLKHPLPTMTGKNGLGIVAPTLIQYHTEQSEKEHRGQALKQPIHTLDTSNQYGLASATLVKEKAVAAFITRFNNHCDGQKPCEPLGTVTSSGGHYGDVRALLIKYYSSADNFQSVDTPLNTITTVDRFGLVTIYGEKYKIVDIGLRMLTPRKLYSAQGFSPDYEIEIDCYGKVYPRKEQVARCGNAVPPPFATAIVRANAPEWCKNINISTMAQWNEFVGGFI